MRTLVHFCLGLATLACAACSSSVSGKTCTQMGCQDQFTLTVALPTGQKPTALAVDLVVDGIPVACAALGDQTHVACSEKIALSLGQGQTCEESRNGSAVTLTCTADGTFHLKLTVAGTPTSVAYTVSSEGVPALQDTLAPTYTELAPNGPGCEPVCQQASATITLPAP